ncbi:DUF4270 domain-containing protein [Prevotella sp. A2931]|uniref:DUF4270 domain-containing protein n=1 Tax=Prevotella illustrans TaxID=2800387 RepID=A0ABS3M2P5_9BACT|nr:MULTISPECIES: DUF4270 domain-containing protein [Prevotella]MBO1362356.1 DUF4270 domain-containing protein [Prevotella illustrans]PTL25124.1 DUF4270 domain-containing protein [Prevotella sp. oral taxon 820]
MKAKILVSVLLASLSLAACDESTEEIGISLVEHSDLLDVSTDSFIVASKSILVDSVFGKSNIGYLGRIKDPETGAFVSSSFMTQVATIENYSFPKEEFVQNKVDGEAQADSCVLNLFFSEFYGDSLAPLKIKMQELVKVLPETTYYYTNFDIKEHGYLRKDGIDKDKVCTLADLTAPDSLRASTNYEKHIKFALNDPYTDQSGKTYSNFGTYILQTYYKHPEYFQNSQLFRTHVVPGFNFTIQSGLGAMMYIANVQLNVYLTYKVNDKSKAQVHMASFPGTGEILQISKINNDKLRLQQLVDDNSCTYLKTPAGIFTELTLPVDDILKGHERDSINSAKIVLQRINDNGLNDYNLPVTTQLLMLPKDSLISFFEKGSVGDNIYSYAISRDYSVDANNKFSSYKNTFTFSNISQLIKNLAAKKANGNLSPNWNKVVIVPITTTTATINRVTYTTSVRHNMALTSTRLVGGANNSRAPLKISVIYSKFK